MGFVRLFLAFGVLMSHTCDTVLQSVNASCPNWTFNITGGRAVIFFYIVSGFLISWVLEQKYDNTARGTREFYLARALRIYPLWLVVIAICMANPGPEWKPRFALEALPSILLFGYDWLVAFGSYPKQYWAFAPAYSGVGWTLGAELTFYLLAPWLLRSDRRALIAFTISALVRAWTFWTFWSWPPTPVYVIWSYFFLPSTFMFFVLGHLGRRLLAVTNIRPGFWSSVVLLEAALWCSYQDLPISVDRPLSYAAAGLFALSLPGIFQATKNSRLSNFFGDLTYPLYLTHSLAINYVFWRTGVGIAALEQAKAVPILSDTIITLSVAATAFAVAVFARFAMELPAKGLSLDLIRALVAARRSIPALPRLPFVRVVPAPGE